MGGTFHRSDGSAWAPASQGPAGRSAYGISTRNAKTAINADTVISVTMQLKRHGDSQRCAEYKMSERRCAADQKACSQTMHLARAPAHRTRAKQRLFPTSER